MGVPLSLEQLQQALTENLSKDALYDLLSSYEDEACQQFTPGAITGDAKVLTAYYSSFLFSHLLIDEM